MRVKIVRPCQPEGRQREWKVDASESAVITIVDDDESVREALKSLIRSVGFKAETFASGEEFLNSDRLRDTACLILDVQMPGISGFELQNRLASLQNRVPVVFITAHGNEEDRKRALQAGAVDFLRKPFSEEALLDAVHSALETPQGGGLSPP
jgi:FixJ family two-component response regulator